MGRRRSLVLQNTTMQLLIHILYHILINSHFNQIKGMKHTAPFNSSINAQPHCHAIFGVALMHYNQTCRYQYCNTISGETKN